MRVVEREVLRPVRARFRQFQDGLEKRRIIRPRFQWGHLHFCAFGQLRLRGQHHHTVFDCAFVAHVFVLTRIRSQRKQPRNPMQSTLRPTTP